MTIDITPNPIFDNTFGYVVGAAYWFGLATMISYALSKIPGWITGAILTFCLGSAVVLFMINGENMAALHVSLYFVPSCFATFFSYTLKKNTKNS